MNLDFRALCAELIDALDGWHQAVLETGSGWVKPDEACLLDRARAALAQPEPEVVEPTDEELLKMWWREEGWEPGESWDALTFARAVLARWGHQPAPAPAGEVGDPSPELVHRWEVDGQHHTYETPLSIHIATQAARWGAAQVVHRSAVPVADGPAVPEGREPASVVGEPTDEELRAVWCDGWNTSEEWGALNFARAVLARFGHHSPDATKMVYDAYQMGRRDASADSQQAAEAAENEVVDEVRYVVYELRDQADDLSPSSELFGLIHNAADLLERRHPVPVPVSERLPGPEDCDGEGRCWFFDPCDDGWWWYRSALFLDGDPCPLTHWLPANALPLPSEEVK